MMPCCPASSAGNRLLPYVEIVHAGAAASVAVQEREDGTPCEPAAIDA